MKLRLEVRTKLSGASSHASCPLVYSRREIGAGLISDHATSYQTDLHSQTLTGETPREQGY